MHLSTQVKFVKNFTAVFYVGTHRNFAQNKILSLPQAPLSCFIETRGFISVLSNAVASSATAIQE